MKKVYERPTMELEVFKADEYVAACGDMGTDYTITCDAEAGWVDVLYNEFGAPIQYGHEHCGTTYNVNEEDIHKGYIVLVNGVNEVKYWKDENGYYHFSKEVSKEDWVINFS